MSKKATKKKTKKKVAKKVSKKVAVKRQVEKKPEIEAGAVPKFKESFLLSQSDIAELFGVTVRSVQNWPVKPTTKRGRRVMYYLPDVIAFKMERAEASPSTSFEYLEERARLTHHQANLAALEEKVKEGELFDAPEVLMLCAGTHSAARNRVLGIHSNIASAYPELDIEVIETIEEVSIEALNLLGKDGIPAGLRERVRTAIRRMESATQENS